MRLKFAWAADFLDWLYWIQYWIQYLLVKTLVAADDLLTRAADSYYPLCAGLPVRPRRGSLSPPTRGIGNVSFQHGFRTFLGH